jgi:PAS domain S-box-containing protein
MAARSVSGRLIATVGLLAFGAIWAVLVERTLAPGDDALRILLHTLFAAAAAAALWWITRPRKDADDWGRGRTATFLAETQALAHVGCWTWEIGTDRVEWSDALYGIYGLEPGEPIDYGRFLSAVHPDDRLDVHELITRAVESGEPYAYEKRIVRPDGTVRDIHGKGRVERGEDGRPVRLYGVCQDVTEREVARRALMRKEELRHAARVEAIGRLAAGAAHDFNNLLTTIRGYTDLTLRAEDLSATHRVALEEVMNASDRASQLTRQLLALGREAEAEPRRVDLNSIVRGMEPMIAPHYGEGIQLELRLEPELWPVQADPLQLEQVILNLAVNATDAMPEGGALEIRTANEPADSTGSREPGVRLEVSDTGTGIPEEVRPHLFEPFYTTQGGRGTGLGLATVYAIVLRNRGTVDFTTDAEKGTTFVVRIPRHLSALEDDPDGA